MTKLSLYYKREINVLQQNCYLQAETLHNLKLQQEHQMEICMKITIVVQEKLKSTYIFYVFCFEQLLVLKHVCQYPKLLHQEVLITS